MLRSRRTKRIRQRRNVLVVQSGGCAAVMNRSLAGVVQEVFKNSSFGEVYGAIHGLSGILQESFLDLRRQPSRICTGVANTPGAALGSGRRGLHPEDIPQVLKTLTRYRIGYLFSIGGNDSAETAHLIAEGTRTVGQEMTVIHVPKTIDNDLTATDHTPGYGSAARFVALATMGPGRDAEAMGDASPVTILEVMGRDAGWLAAAAALGKRYEMDAPHAICVPEVTVDEVRFLNRMEEAYRRWGFAVAVTAENASGPGAVGRPAEPPLRRRLRPPVFRGSRSLSDPAGRPRAGSAGKVREARDHPAVFYGMCVSRTDALEASLVGRAAVRYALDGHSDSMVILVRQPRSVYECDTGLASLEVVAGNVKCLPPEFINTSPELVTEAYLKYARPLVGGPMPRYRRLMWSETVP